MNTLLDQVKRDHSISISWTPAHTNSDDHLAQGNAVADHLAARGCAAPHLLTHFRLPALAFRSSAPVGRSVGPRSNWRAAARSAPPPLGETHACLRLIPANPTLGELSFVALLGVFVLSLALHSPFMIIMGTWWATNYFVRV